MPLPDMPHFESLLDSLTILEPNNTERYKSVVIVPSVLLQDGDVYYEDNEYRMWYVDLSELNIEALVRRVQEELNKKNHVVDRNTTLVLLGLYSLIIRPINTSVKILNSIIENIVPGDLKQVFIMPAPPPNNYELRLGSFRFGLFDKEIISYLCSKVKSDFYTKYENKLVGKFTIERDDHEVNLVDWVKIFKEHKLKNPRSTVDILINNYFLYLSSKQFDRFWDLLKKQQLFTVALGATYVDGAALRLIPRVYSISVYMNVGQSKWGFVAPNASIPNIDLGGSDKNIPKTIKVLNSYGIDIEEINKSELYLSLTSFAEFIQRARFHLFGERKDEGFLHYIIALDLLLGEKNKNTATVSSRVAVLTYRAFQKEYNDQKLMIEELYDKRSLYVHQGKSIKDQDLEDTEAVCKEVLFCLFRMYKNGRGSQNDFILNWHKDLDYLSSAIEANRVISEEVIFENGILPEVKS